MCKVSRVAYTSRTTSFHTNYAQNNHLRMLNATHKKYISQTKAKPVQCYVCKCVFVSLFPSAHLARLYAPCDVPILLNIVNCLHAYVCWKDPPTPPVPPAAAAAIECAKQSNKHAERVYTSQIKLNS